MPSQPAKFESMPGAIGLCPNHPQEFYVALEADITDEICPQCGEWLEIFSRDGGVEQDGRSGRGQLAATSGGAEPDADAGEGAVRSAREGEVRSNQPTSPSEFLTAAVNAVQEEFDERGLGDATLLVQVILDESGYPDAMTRLRKKIKDLKVMIDDPDTLDMVEDILDNDARWTW
jgi:hypothetical protein